MSTGELSSLPPEVCPEFAGAPHEAARKHLTQEERGNRLIGKAVNGLVETVTVYLQTKFEELYLQRAQVLRLNHDDIERLVGEHIEEFRDLVREKCARILLDGNMEEIQIDLSRRFAECIRAVTRKVERMRPTAA